MRFRFLAVTALFVFALNQDAVHAQSPAQFEKFGDKAVADRNAWDEAFGYYKHTRLIAVRSRLEENWQMQRVR